MNQGARGIIEWIRTAYDKLALFIVLFVLLVSVILLGVFVDREKKELEAARWNVPTAPPKKSKPVDVTPLHEAIASLAEPLQMGVGSNRMLVAEERVACVKCKCPIPSQAKVCPYQNCGATQPPSKVPDQEGVDTNGDGIPDKWAKENGFDPKAGIAQQDADGDGFTNLEEYQYQTKPTDSNDFPPPAIKLKWVKIDRLTLPLSFQSVLRPAPDERIFILKNKKTGRDYYVKKGDKVEGYEVIDYEEKQVEVIRPGVPPIMVDASILKLRKGDKVITLTVGKDSGEGEMTAELIFLVDQSKYRVKVNDEIVLKNIRYKVVDIQTNVVVVSENSTGNKTSLEKHSAADRPKLSREESRDK